MKNLSNLVKNDILSGLDRHFEKQAKPRKELEARLEKLGINKNNSVYKIMEKIEQRKLKKSSLKVN